MERNKLPYLLTIGGLDPSGHAGILADAEVFQHFKVPFRAVATALTAQSEKKFLRWEPVSLPLFKDQLQAVEDGLFGVKIGMLTSPAHAAVLVQWLQRLKPHHVVWDPVWKSTTGKKLFRGAFSDRRVQGLLRHIHTLTPNHPEADVFLGKQKSRSRESTLSALAALGPRTVILKGGHEASAPTQATDWVYHGKKSFKLSGPRRKLRRRGTGCRFASAYLVGISRGMSALQAARFAKRFVLYRVFDAPAP